MHYDTFKSVIENKLLTHIPALISAWRTNSSSNKAQLSHDEIQHVSKALLSLQRGLTGDRQLAGAGYMDDSAMLGAYLLYYWPVSYMQMSYIVSDCKKQIDSIINKKQTRPIRILDLGSGPAPASAAIVDCLLDNAVCNQPQLEITLVDSSEKAMLLAQKILLKEFKSISVKTIQTNFEKSGISLLKGSNDSNQYDIIVMCHAINELWNGNVNKQAEFIRDVSNRLAQGGCILLCEPALLSTSRNLLSLRDILIHDELGVVAPCPYNTKSCLAICPALTAGENHTCHAEIDWRPCEPVASIAKEAALDRESVKMTYIVLQNRNDIESNDCDSTKQNLCGRIVSEGMLNKAGRIRYLVCNGEKRIAVSAKKDDIYAKQIGFFSLKRLDKVEMNNLEIRGDSQSIAYGICGKTSLLIE